MAEKIAFDARMWSHPGIGRYIRELLGALIRLEKKPALCLLGRSKELGAMFMPATGFSIREASSGIYGLAEQLEIPRLARGMGLLHVPHFNVPLLTSAKLVVTVHDLTYLHGSEALKSRSGRAYVRFLFRFIARNAAAIITVSEYTKKDLMEFFPVRAEKVFVIPEAASDMFYKISDPNKLEKQLCFGSSGRPFILFVGSLKPHKNIPALVTAVSNLREKKRIEHQLLIVGRKDKKNPEILKLIESNPYVSYLGEVSDEKLATLYNLADLFVLPSFREGFGLPVVEAMACGTPVAVSDRTSLPELVGEAGQLFDPDRIDALEHVIYNILENKDLRQKMSLAGLERSKEFSWQNTAKNTLKVYQQVLG